MRDVQCYATERDGHPPYSAVKRPPNSHSRFFRAAGDFSRTLPFLSGRLGADEEVAG